MVLLYLMKKSNSYQERKFEKNQVGKEVEKYIKYM